MVCFFLIGSCCLRVMCRSLVHWACGDWLYQCEWLPVCLQTLWGWQHHLDRYNQTSIIIVRSHHIRCSRHSKKDKVAQVAPYSFLAVCMTKIVPRGAVVLTSALVNQKSCHTIMSWESVSSLKFWEFYGSVGFSMYLQFRWLFLQQCSHLLVWLVDWTMSKIYHSPFEHYSNHLN